MEIAASTHHISKDFFIDGTATKVLHDISFDLRMGELTMLVGPSGCGKTTLISILSGILTPTSGEVDVIKHRITSMSDEEKVIFRRNNIGLIFQEYNLLGALSAVENASIPLLAAGVAYEAANSRSQVILDKIGMEGHGDKLPRQLSGGQNQRVAIARALVHNPKLIICDEPTAALDAKTGQGVLEVLREVANDANRAVLIVTHDVRIFHFADRIIEMSDGRVIGDHGAEAFLKKENL